MKWRAADKTGPFTCEVRDIDNSVVPSEVRVQGNGEVWVSLNLPAGYYEATFQPGGQRFGIVAAAPFAGAPDKFFAIDAALSWLETNPGNRAELIAILKRSGIGLVRERLSWGAINPRAEQWDWETARRFDTLRGEYARQGVQVLELFHAAPGWTRPESSNPFPQDLAATAASWQTIARRWGGNWNGFEVWNEPDIDSGGDLPADQYLPAVKTISYAFQQDAIPVKVGGGVFGYFNPNYIRGSVQNGLLDQVDFVSFHTYAKAPAMEQIVDDYRRALTVKGRAPLPLWLTESGQPWTSGPDRPGAAEDSASALDIAMKAVEARACGIARNFAFVYPFYVEGQRNFGMMGREVTPLRSMAAYVQATNALSNTTYLGDLRSKPASLTRARIFARADVAVIVLYSDAAGASAAMAWSGPVRGVQGIDGRALKRLPDGSIPVPDGLTYVHVSRESLKNLVQTQTRAAELTAAAKQARLARPEASPIVLQPLLPKTVLASKRGYKVAEADRAEFPFKIRVNNLSDTPKQAKLRCTVNGVAELAPLAVELKPRSASEVGWNVDLVRALQNPSAESVQLDVSAVQPDGIAISPLAVTLLFERDLKENLVLYPASTRLDVTQMDRWQPNIAPTGQMKMLLAEDGAWRLQTTFQAGDRWVFPNYLPAAGTDFTGSQGLIARARAFAPATVRLMVKERSGATYFTPFSVISPDGQWHSFVLHWPDLAALPSAPPDANGQLDLDQIVSLSLGMNSKASENQLELSDLYIARKFSPPTAAKKP